MQFLCHSILIRFKIIFVILFDSVPSYSILYVVAGHSGPPNNGVKIMAAILLTLSLTLLVGMAERLLGESDRRAMGDLHHRILQRQRQG